MNAKDAAATFDRSESEALAVVQSADSRQVLGLLTESHTLKRYSEELDRQRRAMAGNLRDCQAGFDRRSACNTLAPCNPGPVRGPRRDTREDPWAGQDSSPQRRYRIAVIPGDGIGKEVVPEGVRVLEQAAKRHGFALQLDWFDFASCDYYEQHGRMMPEDWKPQIEKHDAIYFGAVGMPERVPDHISLWGSLILFRREFDQYANLRPVRLMPG